MWGKTYTISSTTKERIIWWIAFKCTFIYSKSTALGTFFTSSYGVRYLGNPHVGGQARALTTPLGVRVSYQGETSKPSKHLKWEAQVTGTLPVLACRLGWTWNLTNINGAPTVCQAGNRDNRHTANSHNRHSIGVEWMTHDNQVVCTIHAAGSGGTHRLACD